MITETEPTTIGLSEATHGKLKRLKEEGHFAEMADAYRFAIALALAYGVTPNTVSGSRTIFNVGTLDPDKNLYAAVRALRLDTDEPVYRTAEKLAEWGVEEIFKMAEGGEITYTKLFKEVMQRPSATSK